MRILVVATLVATAQALRVTVLGGTGFVGSRAVKQLVEVHGAEVRSVSMTGKPPAWCADEDWVSKVDWVSTDLLRGPREDVATAMGQPDAVVSCVGTVGFDRQGLLQGNGKANLEALNAAVKVGSVKSYTLVSVASEVEDSRTWLPNFFAGYFDGKQQAMGAIASAMAEEGKQFTFVKPTFIYGGDDFGLFPPRVSAWYGSCIEELLSLGPINAVANVMPGLIKVALRPPVSVEAVAGACAKAAVGEVTAEVLDATSEINEAAGQPAATGLTDLRKTLSAKFSELTAEQA